jgi:hypothetical protein
MTKFSLGDMALVDFDGLEHVAEILRVERGWVTAVIQVDPDADYGSLSPRLAPHSTVCVPEKRVRFPDEEN